MDGRRNFAARLRNRRFFGRGHCAGRPFIRFRNNRSAGSASCCELPLKISYFALKGGMLAGVFFFQLVNTLSQSAIPPKQSESDKGSDDQQDPKEHQNER